MSKRIVWGMLGLLAACGSDRERIAADDAGPGATFSSDADAPSSADAGLSAPGPEKQDDPCAWVDARPAVVPSTLWIVANPSAINQLPNVAELFAWQERTFREMVLADNGALSPFDNVIRFGAIWHGMRDEASACPGLTMIPPADHNFKVVRSSFPNIPDIAAASKAQYALESILHDAPNDGQTAVLYVVTDTPYACTSDKKMQQIDGEAMAYGLMQVQALRKRGIRTFVLNMTLGGGDSEPYSENDYAAAGGTEEAIPAEDTAALRVALDSMVRSLVSCDIKLDGQVDEGEECRGEVRIGAAVVPCNTADGYRLKDPSTLTLVGQACESLRNTPDATVSARFPCGVLLR